MIIRSALAAALLLAAPVPATAHHGWGSYAANKPLTLTGKVQTSKFENPHVTLTMQSGAKTWTVTLAPTSRMISRGALAKLVAVGSEITAYGYPSNAEPNEMRAERIVVAGKSYEMR